MVALLALECEERGVLPPDSLERQHWERNATAPDAALSDHWLLAYEAHLKGWLPNPDLNSHPVFGPMLEAQVSFFDSELCRLQHPTAALQFPGGLLAEGYA